MRTLGREIISTRQEKLAKLARIEPKLVLTTLAHHIDEVWLREAYRRTRKEGAVGVDGVTAAQYETELEANLASLLERFKSGRYRAPAVRRVHIPKPGKANKTRPIGIPTLEDKVLQRAVLMVLEPVFEQARQVRLQFGLVLRCRHTVYPHRAVLARTPVRFAQPHLVDVMRQRRQYPLRLDPSQFR